VKLFRRKKKGADPSRDRALSDLPLQYVFSRSIDRGNSSSTAPYEIPILIVKYFPVRDGMIDRGVTGDVGGPLEDVRRHTEDVTERVIWALETGSAYHGYRDPTAQPSLRYLIADNIEFLEALPLHRKGGHRLPMTDYNSIMERIAIRDWVEDQGIKEVWIWGYHGGVIDIWESNMAGPHGDISNSDRDLYDLPALKETYTVYHYNYQRGVSEAVEDHLHQIESVLGHVGRDLFWERFVGKPLEGRCGWSHYPPNGERDYDWANPRSVWTDIEHWRPDGTGERKQLSSRRWRGDSLTWFIYWMQNLPGANNNLTYRGRRLTNWWMFIGDFDSAMDAGQGLLEQR
jgi:hypothetical protein